MDYHVTGVDASTGTLVAQPMGTRKRSAPSSEEPRKRRQLPVSCYFCRTKKLKCDRNTPCGSCVKRGLQDNCVPAAVIESEAEALAVKPTSISVFAQHSPASSNTVTAKQKLSTTDFFDRATTGNNPFTRGAEEDPSNSALFHSVNAILEMVFALKPMAETPLKSNEIREYMPSLSQALRLLDHYVDKVNWSFALVHPPTIRSNLIDLYRQMEHSQTVNAAKAGLVCTVLGLSAHFRTASLMDEELARESAKNLLSMARKCIQSSGFPEIPTLDTLQAVTLVTYLLSTSVDIRPNMMLTYGSLADIAARSLRIHQMDNDTNKLRRERDGCDLVEVELMRRLWWALASSEWLHAHNAGVLRYSIHPMHFNVSFPSHTDNSALDVTGAYSRPPSQPTDMSYFLLRLNLADMARQVIDICAKAGCCSLAELDYDEVLVLDARLRATWENLPMFWRLDEESQRACQALRREHPYIAYDTFIIHIGFYSKLSALHRPYLARALKDKRFEWSRTVSLDSARTAIHFAKQMHLSDLDVSPALLNVSTATKNTFTSILVLAMDYYFNDKSLAMKEEINDACKILERSASQNTVVQRGLSELRSALDDWKQNNLKENDTQQPPEHNGAPSIAQSNGLHNSFGSHDHDFNQHDDPLLQWLDFDMSMDATDWDDLLLQLDNTR